MFKKIKRGRVITLFILGICSTTISTAWITSGHLVSPPRRALQSYHHDILNHPEKHGIEITKSACQQTNTPYLIIEPKGALSERGQIIRNQIDNKKLQPFGQITGNIILLHGRNGRKEDLLSISERFCAVGFRCILIDLPAHGDNSQTFTHYGAHTDDGFIAKHVLDHASSKFNFAKQPAHLWGMSMGGAYANKALLETPSHWKSAITVCTFNTLDQVITNKTSQLPHFIQSPYKKIVHALTKSRSGFDFYHAQPKNWINKVTTPIMVIHGTNDQLIHLDQGKNLFDNYASPEKQWIEVPNANHNNILITPMPLYSKMANWLLANNTEQPSLQ